MFDNFNPQRCAVECSKVLICEGFQYQYTTKRCWLKKTAKSSGPNFQVLNNGALYIRNIKLDLPGYIRYPSKDYPGHDIRHFMNYNREACGNQCDRNPHCLAFEFNVFTRTCSIKRQGKANGPNYKNHANGELFIKQFQG